MPHGPGPVADVRGALRGESRRVQRRRTPRHPRQAAAHRLGGPPGAAQGVRHGHPGHAAAARRRAGDRGGSGQVRTRRRPGSTAPQRCCRTVWRCRSGAPVRRDRPRRDADAVAFRRRGRGHAVVRAVRDRAPGSHGLRRARRGVRGRRDARHGRRRRHRAARCRRALRSAAPTRSARSWRTAGCAALSAGQAAPGYRNAIRGSGSPRRPPPCTAGWRGARCG